MIPSASLLSRLTLPALLALSLPAAAQAWQHFRVGQLGFGFDAPPGFALQENAEADTLAFAGPRGATLAVGGAELDGRSLRALMEGHMRQDAAEGLDVTYRRFTRNWVSYSGFQGDNIRYVRAIRVCGDRVAVFVIDYPREEKEPYDPIVTRMVRSLDPEGC